MQLKPIDQQVLVVFGASSGIGRTTALEAVRRGARVLAVGRDVEALGTLSAETPDGQLVTAVADAAVFEDVARAATAAVEIFGTIDTWAHVAGVAEWSKFEDMTAEEFRRVVEVDLLGPVHGAMAALPHLRANEGGGALVVVSSIIARRGFALLSSYSAAKHGVDGFLESLRAELDADDVPVSVTQVLPATIQTPFFEHARTRIGFRPSGPPPVYPPEKVADAILDAATKPRREVVVGAAGKVMLAMQKVSPRLFDVIASSAAMLRMERSSEPKSVGDGDNLFAVPDGEDRTRGEVTTTSR